MYYLLPFRFHVMHGKELLINDLGDFLVVPRGSVGRIVNREIDTDEELYKDLSASFFISEQPLPRLIDRWQSVWLPEKRFSTISRPSISSC